MRDYKRLQETTTINCNERNNAPLYISAMDTIAQRIATARELKGLNQSELARALSVTPQAVQNWESGKSSPRGSRLKDVAVILGLTVERLLYGDRPGSTASNIGLMAQPSRKPKEYPLITWVSAGERAESPEKGSTGDYDETLSSIENAGVNGYWLKVKGKSMTSDNPPSFPQGTPILVQPEGFDLINGKFYIAKHKDGETTFKQYVRDAGTAYLSPLNPDFKSVEMTDDWRIIGRVIDAKVVGL